MKTPLFVLALLLMLITGPSAWGQPAQPAQPAVPLVLRVGRPIRVAVDRRVIIKRVGQPIAGTLLDALYAYDRMVVPKGTKVTGHVETIVGAPKKTRARAMLAGDFTPLRAALLQFDALELSGGRSLKIRTVSVGAAGREPGRTDRVWDFAIRSLPYHPNFIGKGTVYSAPLVEPVSFGEATPIERAPADSLPAPATVLRARLLTQLDSSGSPSGTRVDAVLTEPVFDASKRLILPEGTALVGEVTFARRARSFRRNGQLRFLVDHIQAPDQPSAPLKASLLAVESSNAKVDQEGGATITNNKARFVAPGLAAMALAGSLHGRLDYDTDGLGPEMQYGGAASGGSGGFLALSVAGMGISMLGRVPSVVLAGIGTTRTVYSTVIAKGRELILASDTVIQLQLAPGPGPKP